MPVVTIDCRDVATVEAFWQRYIDTARPEGAAIFGRNLDAFWDAIESGGPGRPAADLHFTNVDALARREEGRAFLEALDRLAQEASTIRVRID